jgi:hypothetical protein
MALTARTLTSFSSLAKSKAAVARRIEGALAAESTTRTIAQFPVVQAFNASGFDTVLLSIEFGSGSGTATIEPLLLDEDGGVWLQQLTGAPDGVTPTAELEPCVTPALAPGQLVEVPVWGRPAVLFRVEAVSGAPVDLHVLVFPGRPRT